MAIVQRSIWNFVLTYRSEQTISMPKHAELLSVQLRHGVPTLWAIVNPEAVREERTILCHETDALSNPDPRDQYLGTVQADNKAWHFFVC
jgi:hypothetical protein